MSRKGRPRNKGGGKRPGSSATNNVLVISAEDAYPSPRMEQARATIERLETGGLRAIVSTSDLDRDGRVVEQSGWVLDNYRANPIVTWNHDHENLPIGKANVEVVDGKLVADIDFAEFDFAQTVKSLYEGGFLSTFSAGWLPLEESQAREDGTRYFPKNELIEFAATPIPSNPSATVLVQAALKGAMETADSPKPPAPTPPPPPTPPTPPPIPTPSGEVEAVEGEGVPSPSDSPSEPGQAPSPAVVADKGPEAVIPLNDEGLEVLGEALAKNAANADKITVNVHGYAGNPEKLAEQIVRRLGDDEVAAEAAALLKTSAPVLETEENGEGSASIETSGLTTREHAERVAEVAAIAADIVIKRLTGQLV